ncbi:ATP phosphoribosyltransferase [Chloroflexota bacterium]
MHNLKIALPKGLLLVQTATLLEKAGWELSGYQERAASYRLDSHRFPNLLTKIFQEKDIPIQVAIGNYDLGICGLDWVEELLVKYPSSPLVRLRNLGYGEGTLYIVTSHSGAMSPEEIQSRKHNIRIASEYPNLAESFALNLRLRRFSIFPLWGGAEVYPPESAELVLISERTDEESFSQDLTPISKVLDFSAYLIANRDSWERKDLSEILTSIDLTLTSLLVEMKPTDKERLAPAESVSNLEKAKQLLVTGKDSIRLALPDGHQQLPTAQLLSKAGIQIDDYPSVTGNRRPTTSLDGITIKVLRPQDMPLQVSNGNFDLAITGKDWLKEHLYQFPSSPVTELLDLKLGKVKIVAVVSKDLPIADIYSLRQLYTEQSTPIRIASEYINIADKCAQDNHLGIYRVIPTWGASEAFLPEDADLLIENTQTGRTIAQHNLKIIDTLFESSACLIGNRNSITRPTKKERIESITETLRLAVESAQNESN